MPLTQVVEAIILMPGFAEECIQCLGMGFRAPDEMRLPSRLAVNRQVNNSELTGLNLLPHQHTANLSTTRRSERLSQLIFDAIHKFNLHRWPLVEGLRRIP